MPCLGARLSVHSRIMRSCALATGAGTAAGQNSLQDRCASDFASHFFWGGLLCAKYVFRCLLARMHATLSTWSVQRVALMRIGWASRVQKAAPLPTAVLRRSSLRNLWQTCRGLSPTPGSAWHVCERPRAHMGGVGKAGDVTGAVCAPVRAPGVSGHRSTAGRGSARAYHAGRLAALSACHAPQHSALLVSNPCHGPQGRGPRGGRAVASSPDRFRGCRLFPAFSCTCKAAKQWPLPCFFMRGGCDFVRLATPP